MDTPYNLHFMYKKNDNNGLSQIYKQQVENY